MAGNININTVKEIINLIEEFEQEDKNEELIKNNSDILNDCINYIEESSENCSDDIELDKNNFSKNCDLDFNLESEKNDRNNMDLNDCNNKGEKEDSSLDSKEDSKSDSEYPENEHLDLEKIKKDRGELNVFTFDLKNNNYNPKDILFYEDSDLNNIENKLDKIKINENKSNIFLCF